MGQLTFQIDRGNYPDEDRRYYKSETKDGKEVDNKGAENVDKLQEIINVYLGLPNSSPRPLPNPSPEGKIKIGDYEFSAPRSDSQRPQKFLNIDGYAGPLYLTDNVESRIVSPGNKLILRRYNGRFRALDQRDNPNFKVIIFSPLWLTGRLPDRKPPVNTLIHEIGHMKWPNLGLDEDNHDIRFYALLFNALVHLGIAPDWSEDLQRLPNDSKKNAEILEYGINMLPPSATSDPLGFSFSRNKCLENLPGTPPPPPGSPRVGKLQCTEILR